MKALWNTKRFQLAGSQANKIFRLWKADSVQLKKHVSRHQFGIIPISIDLSDMAALPQRYIEIFEIGITGAADKINMQLFSFCCDLFQISYTNMVLEIKLISSTWR